MKDALKKVGEVAADVAKKMVDNNKLLPGDIVMYPIPAEVPVPFYKFGWVAVNENRILCVINEKLTERKNGR